MYDLPVAPDVQNYDRAFIPRKSAIGTSLSPVKSAERTVRILEILASSDTRLTMSDLAELTGYPKSSLYALVETLTYLGWIEHDPLDSRVGLGPNALITGSAYLDRDPVIPYARRALENLRAASNHTFHYGRLIDAHMLYLATRASPDRDRKELRIGRCLPAHATSLGQALLAERTPSEVDELLDEPLVKLTEYTITDKAKLHEELERVRARGWAKEVQQSRYDVTCLAVTVGYRIPATDAISCAISIDIATDAELRKVLVLLQDEAQRLAAELRQNGIR